MRIKTANLSGVALDWAVGACENRNPPNGTDRDDNFFEPSTNWAQGGPIIEREKICTMCPVTGDFWDARLHVFPPVYWRGPTPLVAAMRCYVAGKLGDEVEVLEDLT